MSTIIPLLLAAWYLVAAPANIQGSPAEVVKAFYAACNAGEYSKAEKLATKESMDNLKTTFAMAGGLRGYCDQMTNEGTLTRLEVTNERLRGEGARISITLHYKGGETETGEETLLRVDGAWKLQVLGQAR